MQPPAKPRGSYAYKESRRPGATGVRGFGDARCTHLYLSEWSRGIFSAHTIVCFVNCELQRSKHCGCATRMLPLMVHVVLPCIVSGV